MTHRPIAAARVVTDGASTTTGPDGRFTIRDVPYGIILLTATAGGYQGAQQKATVLAGTPPQVALSLYSSEVMSDKGRAAAARAVAEQHGFAQRKSHGPRDGATFYTFEDLDGLNVSRTSDIVLRNFALADVDPGIGHGFFGVQGGVPYMCTPTFYIDGVLATDVRTPLDVDAEAPLRGLAAIELYHDESPKQFPSGPVQNGHTCGVVILWRLPRPLWAESDRH